MIRFNVATGLPYTRNALLSGNPNARIQQDDWIHGRLLDVKTVPGYNRYLALRRVNPLAAQALLQGLKTKAAERERQDPRYWRTDVSPRRPVSSSSSWIGDATYDPVGKNLLIKIGAKTYTVPGQTAQQVKAFLESPSLGRYFNQHYRTSR